MNLHCIVHICEAVRSCAQNATLTCSVLPLEWIKFCGKQLNTALVYLSQKSILGRGMPLWLRTRLYVLLKKISVLIYVGFLRSPFFPSIETPLKKFHKNIFVGNGVTMEKRFVSYSKQLINRLYVHNFFKQIETHRRKRSDAHKCTWP